MQVIGTFPILLMSPEIVMAPPTGCVLGEQSLVTVALGAPVVAQVTEFDVLVKLPPQLARVGVQVAVTVSVKSPHVVGVKLPV